MNDPVIILGIRKGSIRTASSILPKKMVSDRRTFWQLINTVLEGCLNRCGIEATITVGEDEETLVVTGQRLGKHGRQRKQ